eukprot:m.182388 g.182388  ORF g.182388 m.182388 type:complete len:628 (+) comp15525_c0_seq1:374-2257(+)
MLLVLFALIMQVTALSQERRTIRACDENDPGGYVFASLSRPDDVVVFTNGLPHANFYKVFTDLDVGDVKKTLQGGRFKAVPFSENNYSFRCAFGLPSAVKSDVLNHESVVVTPAISFGYQVALCAHPPQHRRKELIGKYMTLVIDGKISRTNARYLPVVEPAKPHKHFFCACLLMWYRAEFLLEWLWYHTVVHGLEKVFVYDNDSEIDNLEDMIKILKIFFNIEYVSWKYKKTQPAYHAHCMVLAGRECKWVKTTDVDEFLYTEADTGPVTNILQSAPKVYGGLNLGMLMVNSGTTELVRKPDGGVLRNYRCVGWKTNHKGLIRPETLHRTLFHTIHLYHYKRPYKAHSVAIKSLTQNLKGKIVLFHFKTQAWEVFMRKYIRRASPVSTPFKLAHPITVDKPADSWKDAVKKECKQPDYNGLFESAQCYLTAKKCPHNGTMANNFKSLVTGLSVSQYIGPWLQMQKEKYPSLANLVVEDWNTTMQPRRINETLGTSQEQYALVFHVVESPRAGIARLAKSSTPVELRSAMYKWIIESEKLDLMTDKRIRKDQFNLKELCLATHNSSDECSNLPHNTGSMMLPRETTQKKIDFSWEDLAALDEHAARLAMRLGAKYGYMTKNFSSSRT